MEEISKKVSFSWKTNWLFEYFFLLSSGICVLKISHLIWSQHWQLPIIDGHLKNGIIESVYCVLYLLDLWEKLNLTFGCSFKSRGLGISFSTF